MTIVNIVRKDGGCLKQILKRSALFSSSIDFFSLNSFKVDVGSIGFI
ncbi:MAG: hypothetical protein LBD84_06675 [Campylobacteraceae bacterium]|jgi:hypothetical protein|nr:hypothetical protein [Campylobacteraceae bacterium]